MEKSIDSVPKEKDYLTLNGLVDAIDKGKIFYTIEVVDGGSLKECFLGTKTMTMLFGPTIVGTGNLSVRWILEHVRDPDVETDTLKMVMIRNTVTEQSDDDTYLQLGNKLFDPDTDTLIFSLSLIGAGQVFSLMSDKIDSIDFKIFTQTTTDGVVYLRKRDSGDIVATTDESQAGIFRILPL